MSWPGSSRPLLYGLQLMARAPSYRGARGASEPEISRFRVRLFEAPRNDDVRGNGQSRRDLRSPRPARGERPYRIERCDTGEGDSPRTELVEAAPHPDPLPVKDGERGEKHLNIEIPGSRWRGPRNDGACGYEESRRDLRPPRPARGERPYRIVRCDTGEGDSPRTELVEAAPHPDPLPVKDGERGKKHLSRKPACDHLAHDLAADGLVAGRGVMPPPAVLFHLLRGSDKALLHLGKIGVGIVQAEDEAAGADPAQRQPLGAQVILQHPVVARRRGVVDHPDRREVGDLDRQPLGRQRRVERLRPAVPDVVEAVIDRAEILSLDRKSVV